jgi:hypothetical protein
VKLLRKLQAEYEEIMKNLCHPFSFEEFQKLRDRRKVLLGRSASPSAKPEHPGTPLVTQMIKNPPV